MGRSDRPPARLGARASWPTVARGPAAAPSPEATEDLAVESPLTRVFLGRLSVEPVRSSRLVKVSFESHYAALAARVANTLAEAFVAQTLEFRADASRYATGFLGRQMADARTRLEKAEQQLSAFVRAKGINFVSSDRLARARGPGHARARHPLRRAGEGAERTNRQGEPGRGGPTRGTSTALPAVLQSPVIVKLKGDLATLEAQQPRAGANLPARVPADAAGWSRASASCARRSAPRSSA